MRVKPKNLEYLEELALKREVKRKRKTKMKVTGKSVFELKRLIFKKSRYGSGN